jgi:hypothetical protein
MTNADGVSEVSWASPEAGFWVAVNFGDFGGTVERSPDGYSVRNTFGEMLGAWDDLDDARQQLARHVSEDHLRTSSQHRR